MNHCKWERRVFLNYLALLQKRIGRPEEFSVSAIMAEGENILMIKECTEHSAGS